jgi:hypothetical protein
VFSSLLHCCRMDIRYCVVFADGKLQTIYSGNYIADTVRYVQDLMQWIFCFLLVPSGDFRFHFWEWISWKMGIFPHRWQNIPVHCSRRDLNAWTGGGVCRCHACLCGDFNAHVGISREIAGDWGFVLNVCVGFSKSTRRLT